MSDTTFKIIQRTYYLRTYIFQCTTAEIVAKGSPSAQEILVKIDEVYGILRSKPSPFAAINCHMALVMVLKPQEACPHLTRALENVDLVEETRIPSMLSRDRHSLLKWCLQQRNCLYNLIVRLREEWQFGDIYPRPIGCPIPEATLEQRYQATLITAVAQPLVGSPVKHQSAVGDRSQAVSPQLATATVSSKQLEFFENPSEEELCLTAAIIDGPLTLHELSQPQHARDHVTMESIHLDELTEGDIKDMQAKLLLLLRDQRICPVSIFHQCSHRDTPGYPQLQGLDLLQQTHTWIYQNLQDWNSITSLIKRMKTLSMQRGWW